MGQKVHDVLNFHSLNDASFTPHYSADAPGVGVGVSVSIQGDFYQVS